MKKKTGLVVRGRLISGLVLLTIFFLAGSAPAALVDNGDGTVTDTVTCLMWQQASMDRTGDGIRDTMTWQQALSESEDLTLAGYSDWRLPDIHELRSLVDYSRYNPAIDTAFFPDTVSSSYWSSTTYASYAYNAWLVYFNGGNVLYDAGYKSHSYYVRAVRGGQCGSFGSSDHFGFDYISDQVNETCFPVRVEARTASGTLDTSFSGAASLGVNYGGVSPSTLSFSNGVATESCVKVYGQGQNKQLNVQGWGRYGQSNYFATTGGGSCSGRVEIHSNVSGATVVLDRVSGGEQARDETNLFHNAVFTDIPCGSYTLRVEKDGYSRTDNSPLNVHYNLGVYRRSLDLPTAGTKTPVILIPGMMGSTHRGEGFNITPYLKGNYPDKDLVIHWPGRTGWEDLQQTLEEDEGYTVITCPWDWRSESTVSMRKNVEHFLLPAINEALQYSDDGRVNIVAHSMGGLLARAYIQSNLYRGDVHKVALVAVPNLGSANPYFFWQGGDTGTTEKVLDNDFYEKTIEKLWRRTYHKRHWKSCRADKIKEFIEDKGPGMLQLLYTDSFLVKNGSSIPAAAGGNVNTWLKALNNGNGFEQPGDVFSAGDGKVQTRVFAGNRGDSSTLRSIVVGSAAGEGLYPDGKPFGAGSLDCDDDTEATGVGMRWGKGDKTVPLSSATYPFDEGWADGIEMNGANEHAFIMKSFRNSIVQFLGDTAAGSGAPGEIQTLQADSMAQAETETPLLSFSVIGNMRLLVTDGLGRKSGIPADTGEAVNEIPDAEIEADDAVASVVISNPAAGTYILTYYGYNDMDFSLSVTALNAAGEAVEKTYEGFRPAKAQSVTVTYDPASGNLIEVQPLVQAPQEMESEAFTCGTGRCARLKWQASSAAGVSGYVVYRAFVGEPFYREMKRLPAGAVGFDTGDPWDDLEDYPVNAYAVSAIKADETESFFAEEKVDIGYCFPWPMFLPAFTGEGGR